MTTVTVYWKASDAPLRAELIRDGKAGPRSRHFALNLEPLTPEQRQELLTLAPMCERYQGEIGAEPLYLDRRLVITPEPDWHGTWYSQHDVLLDHEPGLDEVLALGAEIKAAQEAAQAFQEEKRAIAAREQQAIDEVARQERLAIDALREAEDLAALQTWRSALAGRITDRQMTALYDRRDRAIQELTAQTREQKKRSWVSAHGSAHLRRAHEAGFSCQQLYAVERAAQEAPGFTVDFYDGANWRERCCPSPEALDVCDAARALGLGEPLVVWLTSAPLTSKTEACDEFDVFEPCEAVVIRGYLGRYDLVRDELR